MDFLIDECIVGRTKTLLKQLSFSVKSVTELGAASDSDEEVLNLAKQHKAILLTADLDFANILLYPPDSHSGIIVLRLRASDNPKEMGKVHDVLKRLLKEMPLTDLSKELTIVVRNKYRIHKE